MDAAVGLAVGLEVGPAVGPAVGLVAGFAVGMVVGVVTGAGAGATSAGSGAPAGCGASAAAGAAGGAVAGVAASAGGPAAEIGPEAAQLMTDCQESHKGLTLVLPCGRDKVSNLKAAGGLQVATDCTTQPDAYESIHGVLWYTRKVACK